MIGIGKNDAKESKLRAQSNKIVVLGSSTRMDGWLGSEESDV